MVDSKQKGSRAELLARDALRKLTGLKFERTPLSGALDAKHGLKSDLYIPNERNRFAIEVKHYKDDHLTSRLLTGKEPQLLQFWMQSIREAEETNKEPLLIFKHDRSKLFVAFVDKPINQYQHMFVSLNTHSFHVALLDDWIICDSPKFIL